MLDFQRMRKQFAVNYTLTSESVDKLLADK